MANRNKPHPESFESQVNWFLDNFKQQRPDIRDELAKIIPSYNKLLKMHARTFEELALLPLAKEKGMNYEYPLFDYDVIKPACPFCKEENRIYKVKQNSYMCRNCGKKFAANYNSISSGAKCDSIKWMQILHCILHAYTIKETCDYCGITPTTYYLIRNRIFYGMQLLLDDAKLYGNIFSDITFTTVSYKGLHLDLPIYPEDSPFSDEGFIPRDPRYRGGQNTLKDRNANSNCIFCCIDEHGHVLARYIGIGKATTRALKTKIEPSKFLLDVPEQDPFTVFKEHQEPDNALKAGSKSKFVSDKERALENFARNVGLDYEGHVYRRNGKQLILGKGQMHIQKVNSLHSRLQKFLSYYNPSSKYLPGYLTLFEFIENTKASDQAIAALFEKITTPNLGLESYDDLYVVPNYLIQWLDDKNALKKIGYNRALGFYLYDIFRTENQKSKKNKSITLSEIEEITGYNAVTLRRNYKALSEAGYREKIIEYYKNKSDKKNKGVIQNTIKAKRIEPIFFKLYDEWSENLKRPWDKRLTMNTFMVEMNAKYNTNYKFDQLRYQFKKIQEQELRQPLPYALRKGKNEIGPATREKALKIYDDFKSLEIEYKRRGEKVPLEHCYSLIAEKYNMTIKSVKDYVYKGRAAKKKELSD